MAPAPAPSGAGDGPRTLAPAFIVRLAESDPATLRLKTCFILNPRSGRVAPAVAPVRALAESLRAEIQLTERPRHAAELAARAVDAGFELVVSVGGDGTMNEVAGALAGTPAMLGLVPCGSGDGLGRQLGIHGPLSHVFDVLRHGAPRVIDSGLVDGHPFFNVAGLGFEAGLAARFNRRTRRGFLGYVAVGTASFRDRRPHDFTFAADGRRETVRASTLAVANSSQWGNDAYLCRDARLDDGELDLVAVPPVTVLNAASLLRHLFTGGLAAAPNVLHRRAARFVVERSAPGALHTDGEVYDAGVAVEFSVRPASLRVLCPRPATGR